MLKCLSFILIFFSLTPLMAELNIKPRAREHFVDRHKISFADGSEATYSGLSNTINLWHEVPFRYSFGLSISPILGKQKAKMITMSL